MEMKRIIIVAIVAAFAQAAGGFPPQRPQPREAPTKLRRIPVNARTITALPRGKHYVADLTKPGMVYEFDVNTSQIDFSRVMVRTAEGEVPIASFLESAFPKDALPGFKL